MDRELWDALVFDAFENPTPNMEHAGNMQGLPLDERRTLVIDRPTVPTIQICVQSADESYTGEWLAPYTDAAWWTKEIERWTDVTWRGSIRIADCTGEPPNGWIYVREADEDEIIIEDRLAQADSWRVPDPHGVRSGWVRSQIVWHPDRVRDSHLDDALFEVSVSHELGHVLGLWHVPPGSGFVMEATVQSRRTDPERWLAQWASLVGPNVQYPGLVRVTPVPALPLVGLVLLAGLLGVVGRRLYIKTLN